MPILFFVRRRQQKRRTERRAQPSPPQSDVHVKFVSKVVASCTWAFEELPPIRKTKWTSSKCTLDVRCGISTIISILLHICTLPVFKMVRINFIPTMLCSHTRLHACSVKNHNFTNAFKSVGCLVWFGQQMCGLWKWFHFLGCLNSTLSLPFPAQNSKHFILDSIVLCYISIISARNFAVAERPNQFQWDKQCGTF